MTDNQITLAYNIIIIVLALLIYVLATQHREEKNRRRWYQSRYYSEPRVHHYKKKGSWKFWIICILILASASCTKEDQLQPEQKKCYQCTVTVNGIRKGIDTCVVDVRQLDFKNEAGISLPWACYEKN